MQYPPVSRVPSHVMLHRANNFPSFLAALLIALLASPLPAKDKEKHPDPADDFFAATALHAVHIHITSAAWDAMQPTRRARAAPLEATSIPAPATRPANGAASTPATAPAPTAGHVKHEDMKHEEAANPASSNPQSTTQHSAPSTQHSDYTEATPLPPHNYGWEYAYVRAQVEIDDQLFADTALRFKGNSSYEGTSRGLKRPMKLDFNRFVHGGKFLGLETLNLANNAFDPSLLRETLSYHVYRSAGVPTPRTTLATVYLTVDGRCDREYLGVYTLIEGVDDDRFLKNHFGSSKIPIFKPEAIRGLPYMGENIADWDRYRAKSKPDNAAARPLIEFVKLLNYADDATFAAKVEDVFDVDTFLRYLACTTLICDLDSILANYHNFYLVVSPTDAAGRHGKVYFLPWDMNLSLASYGGQADQLVNLSINHPWGGTNRLIERIVGIEKYKKQYLDHIRRFTLSFYNEADMVPVMDELQARLLEGDEASAAVIPAAPGSFAALAEDRGRGWGRGANITPRDFIIRRSRSVIAQLDGKLDPALAYIPRGGGGGFNRMGIRANPEMGNLAIMAQVIRQSADANRDFTITPREARDAAAALYYQIADEHRPEFIDLPMLATGLDPILAPYVARQPQGFMRGGFGRGRVIVTPTQLWAKAIFDFADSNGDQKLTLDEFLDATDRLVCLADRNNTSRLDERELTEALDLLVSPPAPGQFPR